MDLFKCKKSNLLDGTFPLNHDCVLKVSYSRSCPLRFEYFTCSSSKSGHYASVFSALSLVKTVEVSSFDNLIL